METDLVDAPPTPLAAAPAPVRPRQSLPPKGSCWYCEKALDSVKRFCNKECADGFDDEAAFTG
ncbi:MAG: hypothetical protein JWP59_4396 [Massilia sp.]|nr:hypothetical protein [Massilia sp.]